MLKQLCLPIIFIVLFFYTTACQANKEVIMPSKPLEIALNITAKDLYEMNPDYKQYQEADAQPMGATFQGYDFPRYQEAPMLFKYSDDEILIDGVMYVMAYDDVKINDGLLTNYDIAFIYNKDRESISDKEAYEKTMAFFKQLQDKGWVYDNSIENPRIASSDSFKFSIHPNGDTYALDFSYPLTFNDWMRLDDGHTWYIRKNTDTFMDIRLDRQTDETTNNRHYLMSLTIYDQVEKVKSAVGADHRKNWEKTYPDIYEKLPLGRLQSETQALKIGLDIQQDQPDYTLPLVLEKTGIDTSKFVSIDPYKITYEEFIKRQEAGEDMTPYYENQPKTKPETTSKTRGRCPANQPCPKSGFWFTHAKADSRAYFKQGDIMPDYPNNHWGNVIWQFDGES